MRFFKPKWSPKYNNYVIINYSMRQFVTDNSWRCWPGYWVINTCDVCTVTGRSLDRFPIWIPKEYRSWLILVTVCNIIINQAKNPISLISVMVWAASAWYIPRITPVLISMPFQYLTWMTRVTLRFKKSLNLLKSIDILPVFFGPKWSQWHPDLQHFICDNMEIITILWYPHVHIYIYFKCIRYKKIRKNQSCFGNVGKPYTTPPTAFHLQ